VRRAQGPGIKPESTKAVSRGFRRHRRAGNRRNLNYPIRDYIAIPPKVDCWGRDWKPGGEDNEVSCTVTCSVFQM
jgi:hypothetical protein